MFEDRQDAGRQLAAALEPYRESPHAVVLGIPRGGVAVAAEVAKTLGLPLDVALAAKVGAPDNPEFAIGAVAADGEVSVNPTSGYTLEEVRELAEPAYNKIAHQNVVFHHHRAPLEVEGRTVIIVDDGFATGLTAMAAADWARRHRAARVIVAAPVAPRTAYEAMHHHADEVVVVEMPSWFSAVGQFYRSFAQTEDAEVLRLLEA